jgi:hypothetical protein
VNHGRPDRAVEDDQLEEVPGLVGPEHQEAKWVVANLIDDDGVSECMVDVGLVDAVPVCRRQDLHTAIS